MFEKHHKRLIKALSDLDQKLEEVLLLARCMTDADRVDFIMRLVEGYKQNIDKEELKIAMVLAAAKLLEIHRDLQNQQETDT